jgi:hypothetical protein
MPNDDLIREIVARACREALKQKSQELADDIARRAGEELASQPASVDRSKDLRDGARLIAGSKTQTEALETLLAAVSAVTPSCGLMILRGAQALGWSCNGLATAEIFKQASLDCTRGVAAQVIGSCAATVAQASELGPSFTAVLGLEGSARILLVPVLLKERVAALLVALSQQNDELTGVELLVQVAELTLDVQSYRKASPAAEPAKPATPPQAVAPVHAASPAARVAPAEPPSAAPAYAPAHQQRVAATQAAQPVMDEAHEKARRFAKLLVEEIKLYNQTNGKVAEGRARGDLYMRLRDDIEKSRGAYQKRYGDTVKDADYFNQELIRILADNNRAVMGPGFPG